MQMRYAVFLCHHKGGAGVLARLQRTGQQHMKNLRCGVGDNAQAVQDGPPRAHQCPDLPGFRQT
eukprot:2143984-Amphidinium_carterae.1